MRVVRLFVDSPLCAGSDLPLAEPVRRHATQVLRLKPGDDVVIFNGDGSQYPGRLYAADGRTVGVRLAHRESPRRESPLRATLVQAVARGEKMDWIVQKATELGVTRIVPVATEHSEVKLDERRRATRHAHWQAVAIAACEQCGRNRLPEILAPAPLAAWLDPARTDVPNERWMLHPGATTRVRDLDTSLAAISLAVGPEGGFGPRDLELLRAVGYRGLGLGPRTLRAETAGVAALAALQSRCGDA